MISRWSFFSEKANWETELLTNGNGGDLCEDVEKWVAIGVDNVVSKRLFVVREEVDRVHGLRGQPIQEAASGRFKSFLIWTTCNLSFSFISCMDLGPGTCTLSKVNIIINSLVFEEYSRPVWSCWARQAPPARSAPSWSCSLLAGRTRPGCKPWQLVKVEDGMTRCYCINTESGSESSTRKPF